jgi:hypothetical protein
MTHEAEGRSRRRFELSIEFDMVAQTYIKLDRVILTTARVAESLGVAVAYGGTKYVGVRGSEERSRNTP